MKHSLYIIASVFIFLSSCESKGTSDGHEVGSHNHGSDAHEHEHEHEEANHEHNTQEVFTIDSNSTEEENVIIDHHEHEENETNHVH